MTKDRLFIAYNAGCDIWELEPFNPSIEWHNKEYIGTYKECKNECKTQMEPRSGHYSDCIEGSIYDY